MAYYKTRCGCNATRNFNVILQVLLKKHIITSTCISFTWPSINYTLIMHLTARELTTCWKLKKVQSRICQLWKTKTFFACNLFMSTRQQFKSSYIYFFLSLILTRQRRLHFISQEFNGKYWNEFILPVLHILHFYPNETLLIAIYIYSYDIYSFRSIFVPDPDINVHYVCQTINGTFTCYISLEIFILFNFYVTIAQ